MTLLSLFDYRLPEKLIAQRPAKDRDQSRLLVLNRQSGAISHDTFYDFPKFLDSGDLLVLNETKVIRARLAGKRKTGGAIELLLIRSTSNGVWETMVKGLSKLKPGEKIIIGDGSATLLEKKDGGVALFQFESENEVYRLLDKYGEAPLPPYIHREGGKADDDDIIRYQTIFAQNEGSCAAPTAGLHFTDEIFDAIKTKGVEIVKLTLHVGPGTFRPIKTESIEDHIMDEEFFSISDETAAAINRAKLKGRRVIAVGSTVTRALETSAQKGGDVVSGESSTSLFITPGFEFKIVDALLTNFHLPKSSLVVMVSAFAKRELILNAYSEAVSQKYRFFSYGDAMFIN